MCQIIHDHENPIRFLNSGIWLFGNLTEVGMMMMFQSQYNNSKTSKMLHTMIIIWYQMLTHIGQSYQYLQHKNMVINKIGFWYEFFFNLTIIIEKSNIIVPLTYEKITYFKVLIYF